MKRFSRKGSTSVAKSFHVTIEDERLLFFTEMTAFVYVTGVLALEMGSMGDVEGYAQMHSGAIRQVPLEPLRDHEFRRKFNHYFDTHPSEILRTIGWEWLQEVLCTHA